MKDGYGSLSVHFGADTRFTCHTYPDASPILAIVTPGLSLALSNRGRGLEEGDVQNAQRLLKAVTRFTAEVERLYALTTLDGDSGESGGEHAA